MISIPHLEVHVTHDCNFQCEGCSHFNQHRFRGTNLSIDLIESWYKKWYTRISPSEIAILGGEPFLNPYLPELCHLTRKYFPFSSEIDLVTNASLIHLHPNLWKDLIETDIRLAVTIHSNSKKYADILLNNKNSKNLHSILHSVYGSMLNDLNSNHLDTTNRMKYNRAWQTLLNTFKNYKSNSIVKNAVTQFHYTCHINI